VRSDSSKRRLPGRDLVAGVNQRLDAVRTVQGETRRAVEAELAHVETELRNIEGAIVQGVVGKTTAALLQDRERRRDALQARPRALTDRPTVSPLRVGPAEIQACLDQLAELLKQSRLPAGSRAGHHDAGGGKMPTLLSRHRSREGG
jgi:hypothetical protein